ncbi:MAG: CHASE4 domain-containing protein [Gammaproteobacteria bacterium]
MKLTIKISIILCFIVALSILTNYGILRGLILSSFIELEHQEAQKDMTRIHEALNANLEELENATGDWSHWDDTYIFAAGEDNNFLEENLALSSLETLNVNYISIYDRSGQLLVSKMYDFVTEEVIHNDNLYLSKLKPDHPYIQATDEVKITTQIVLTKSGPMFIAVSSILDNNSNGPGHGTLIMARFLNEVALEKIHEKTRVNFQLWPADTNKLTVEDQTIFISQSEDLIDNGVVVNEVSDELLSVYSTYRNKNGSPILFLRADVERSISVLGTHSIKYALWGMLIASVLMLIVMGLLFHRFIISPLKKLSEHTLSVSHSGDLSQRLNLEQGDEIGILGREFDDMLDHLSEARHDLQKQSYSAGIAEMAAGVMHNLRNQLSPLVLRLGSLRAILDESSNNNTDRAFSELSTETELTDRGRKMLSYLKASFEESRAKKDQIKTSVDVLGVQLGLVEEILSEQEQFSRTAQELKPEKFSRVIEQAIRFLPDDIGNKSVIKVDSNIDELPPILTDDFMLTQVFHQILVNAMRSLQLSIKNNGRILIRAQLIEKPNHKSMVEVQFEDDGKGIDPSIIDSIFQRGFTTKTDKTKGGLGLHWCSNTLSKMDGNIHARSDGPDKGAIFTISLPVAEIQQATTA